MSKVTGQFCLEVANATWATWFLRAGWKCWIQDLDAKQEMAMAVWKARDTWKGNGGASMRTYFSLVARRHLTNLVSSLSRQKRNAENLYSIDKREHGMCVYDPIDEAPGPRDTAENVERVESLHKGVRSLWPRSVKDVVSLMLGGQTQQQIAEGRGVTKQRVQNLYYKGLSQLKELVSS